MDTVAGAFKSKLKYELMDGNEGIAPKYGETPAVKYWQEETVQRALDEYCKYTKVDEKMQQELAGIASVKRFV